MTENLETLDGLVEAVRVIVAATSSRLTLRQAMAVLIVMQADAAKRDITMSDVLGDIFDAASEDVVILDKSLAKSFDLFFEPSTRDPDALGWVTQVIDPNDRRRKFLRLTKAGRAMAAKIVKATTDEL